MRVRRTDVEIVRMRDVASIEEPGAPAGLPEGRPQWQPLGRVALRRS